MTDPVYFVSLGPGNPELITLESFRILNDADIIFCPSTIAASGEVKSRAADIMSALGIDDKRICRRPVPMKKDRTAAQAVYARMADEGIEACRNGSRVCFAAEGDAGFYTSVQYIREILTSRGISSKRTAGVPAFIAAGACTNLHIAHGEEELHIVPGMITTTELVDKIEAGRSVVIMKCSISEEAVKAAVAANPGYGWNYYEHIGEAREFATTAPEEIIARPFPYFSIVIVRKYIED